MKIAIISDIHDNFHNLIRAIERIHEENCEFIICLGDLMNPGIAKVIATQTIPVHMIWGNNDGDRVEITLASKSQYSAMNVSVATYDFLELDSKKIFITHYDDLAMPMCLSRQYDAVFFGHNHIESKEKVGDCWLVNPGELAASKTGLATMAIYDTEQNTITQITLDDTVTLKTELMMDYLKENRERMGLRSKALQSDRESS